MKLLIVQPGKIGDLVVTTSLFNAVYDSLGQFDLVASNFASDFLKCDKRLGKIYDRRVSPRELRRQQYTHALVLMPSYDFFVKCRLAGIKQVFGTVHANLTKREQLAARLITKRFSYDHATSAEEHYLKMFRALGVDTAAFKRSLDYCQADQEFVDQFFKTNDLADKKVIGLSVTAGKEFKEWGLDNFAQLADWLIGQDYYILGVGATADQGKLTDLSEKLKKQQLFINCAGKFSLRQMTALVDKLFCFIAADTGPLYIADARGIPVIDIMGPCPSSSQQPTGRQAILVGECHNHDHPKCYMMNCPHSQAAEFSRCMSEVDLDVVKSAFNKLVS